MSEEKLLFEGKVVSIQPRIRLMRSFDERSHSYLGYALWVNGVIGSTAREFSIGIGKSIHAKYNFVVGDKISGACMAVVDVRQEPVDYYKVSKIKKIGQSMKELDNNPPWLGIPPSLEEYRHRGHRRLSSRTYETSCRTCIWGCKMPVEIIVDNWNPSRRQYRFEKFCYGPISCKLYKAGATRKVPGRNGMSYEELDWVDEEETGHRSLEE
ncbi:MAG TPA: hypothetical protein DD730_12040 [Desulfosporosinus sp.]|nr:hypothetical protein [Desulfosporosinus sp.]